MKIPPKKPHFFKPILPGFKHGIKIPVGFLKYLKGYEHIKRAVLKRGDKKWRIKVNEHRFEEGNWGKFVEENDLQLGDLLVFRHEGNMEFEVSVFDSTHCDREYGEYLQEEGERGAPSVGVISKKFEVKDLRANASLQLEGKKPNLDAKKVSSRRIRATVPASTSANANSQFVSIIHPYIIGRTVFYLPSAFARPNGLMRRCKMMLKDERQRLWPVQLGKVGPRFAIEKGWPQFREANAVQVGDYYKFELIDNGIIPIAYFHPVRANASFQPEGKKPNFNAKKVSSRRIRATVPASTSAIANSQFVSIIRPYCFRRAVFFLPADFARLNGLMRRCKMMLRDERQRLWPVQLDEVGPRFAFTKGWRQFREANAVQVGDPYKFELIDNGIIPIAYFRPLRANASFQPEGKKPILDTKRVSTLANASTQFISTIRPYCIRSNRLYLPLAFAKSNGLVNRRCKMILRDEKQRPWAVGLEPMRSHIAITRGWPRFREANDVQVGDTYKLEIIDNGTIPELYFHCQYSGKDAKASEKPLTHINQQLDKEN